MKYRTSAVALAGAFVVVTCWVSIPSPPTAMAYSPSKAGLRPMVLIGNLADGCEQYRQDNKHYPGQMNPNAIDSEEGQLTGAQILARAMFTGTTDTGEDRYPVSEYVNYTKGDLIDVDGRTGVITNRYSDDNRPVCYYLARIDVDGIAQFVEADNAAHTDPHKGGDFQEFIQSFEYPGGDANAKTRKFLLLAPGPDRLYFTKDDVTNWSRPLSMGQKALVYVTPLSVAVVIVSIALLVYTRWRMKRISRMMM